MGSDHTPWFDNYDLIVVNSSGGKDSMCAMRAVHTIADCQHSKTPIVVSHQILAQVEWEGVPELTREHAEHYGWPLYTAQYRSKIGEEISLLEYARRRGKWPDSQNRWCTSDFKRDPGNRLVRSIIKDLFHVEHSVEQPCRVLQVFGFRAEESPARAKRPPFALNTRLSVARREVWDWLPVHKWSLEEVWRDIRDSGLRYHFAYDLGMPRLSCAFCILAGKGALMLSGKHNRALLDEYVAIEDEIGHTFQNGRSLRSIRDAIDAGEEIRIEIWKG